jgi:hypothetical protein
LNSKNANKKFKNFRLSASKKNNELQTSIWDAFYQFYSEKINNFPPTNPSREQLIQNLTLLEPNFNNFVQSKQFISWNTQVSLNLSIKDNWLKLTNEQFIQLYAVFIAWLRELETQNLGEQNYELHHILPKFEQGTNDLTNLVDCSALNHSLAHTLRFLFSQNRGDLFGAVSAGVLKETRLNRMQSQKVQEMYDRTTRNPEWQKTHGAKGLANRKKPQMRPRQRALVSEAAKKTQSTNSKYRVSPVTWFMSSLTLIWANHEKPNEEFQTTGASDFLNCNAAAVTRQLISYIFNEKLENSPSLMSSVLAGEGQSRYGWYLTKVRFESGYYAPVLIREAANYALENKFTLSNLAELQQHFNSLSMDVCENILIFSEYYQKFLAEKPKN